MFCKLTYTIQEECYIYNQENNIFLIADIFEIPQKAKAYNGIISTRQRKKLGVSSMR